MEKKNMSKEEEVVKRIKNMSIEEINKKSLEDRKIIFLIKSIGVNNKESLVKLYRDLDISKKSNGVNRLRNIERILGVYSKWSLEKREKIKSNIKEELKRVDINYMSLVEELKRVKKIVLSNKSISSFENKIKLEI